VHAVDQQHGVHQRGGRESSGFREWLRNRPLQPPEQVAEMTPALSSGYRAEAGESRRIVEQVR